MKLIAFDDEKSAGLYKAAINKVDEVYPGVKLAVCEAANIPSRPRQGSIRCPTHPPGNRQNSPHSRPMDCW